MPRLVESSRVVPGRDAEVLGGLSPSTLKIYVAVIATRHDAVDGKSVGKHDLVIRFLRGARRLNPPCPHLVPSWDLRSVLAALRGEPFEPLQSFELKFLSFKRVLITALAPVRRVGDLQAFSVDDSCLEFGPAEYTNSSKFNKQLRFIQVTAAEHMRGRDEAAHITRL